MIEHVIVMAASPSRRMEPLTKTRPKAMLPVLGVPMIARVMEGYYKSGIRRFTVVVGEQEGSVAMWLSTNWHQDVSLRFAPQGHKRGTASTLFATRGLIDEPFIITSCDNLVPEEHIHHLSRFFEAHPSDAAVLSLFYAPDEVVESAGVLLDPRGYVMYISELPTGAHQDFRTALPVYGFTPRVLDYLDRVPIMEQSGERALATAIQMMIDDRELVGAVETPERIRFDTPDDLLQAHIRLLSDFPEPVLHSPIPDNTHLTPPLYVDPGVTIGHNVTLGPNVYLESGSVIGHDAVLTDSVVLGRHIGAGQRVEGEVIVEDQL